MIEEILGGFEWKVVESAIENMEEILGEIIGFAIILFFVVKKLRQQKKGQSGSQAGSGSQVSTTRYQQGGYPNKNNAYGTSPRTQTNAGGAYRAGGVSPRPQANVGAYRPNSASAMPHEHRQSGVYDTYNRKNGRNDAGTMPHKHDSGHYTSMMDVSKLPKGYILLNGEPVRVADLEGK